jgi:tRNA threonylcarbamoyl adenosine modification protein YeaZ
MSNVILAIDTSAGTSVAVVVDGEVRSQRYTSDTMRHAEVVGTYIHDALTDAEVTAHNVTHVAAGMGPGPFTGLRVGIAAADAFAFGSGAILLPMNSHDAIALEFLDTDPGNNVVVITDARRKEEYVSFYTGLDDQGCPNRAHGPAIQKPGEFIVTESAYVQATEVPAGWLGVLAQRMLVAGRAFLPFEALYLRSPDVTMSNGPKRVVQEMRGGQK